MKDWTRDWTDDPEAIVRDVEATAPPQRKAAMTAVSLALHLGIVLALILAQAVRDQKPPKDQPVFPLLLEEPTQPVPRPPRPAIKIPHFVPAPVQPAPAPEAPKAPDDRPLLGFGGHGEKKGLNERPPGPEAKKHGPGTAGEGKGQKEPGQEKPEPAPERPPEPPPAPPPVPDTQKNPEPIPPPERTDESPGGVPRMPSDPFPRPREGAPGMVGGSSTRRQPQSSHTGRPGTRGTGNDFNVGMGGFFGDVEFESGDYPWQDYSIKVYFAVYRAWLRELDGRIPRFERDQTFHHLDNLDGECAIRFVIHRDGSIDQLEDLRPSPMPALDEASSAALRRAVLPPLPEDFPRNQERVTFRFRLSGFQSARQLQRQLEYSRANGDF